MKHLATVFGLVVAMNLSAAATPPARLSRPVLEDKIRGGWAGQMIGVAYGAPTEFRWRGIERNGGQVGASEVVIPVQQPQPPPLEQWSPGIPDRRMAARNKAWTWSRHWQSQSNAVSTVEADAEATLRFKGVAVAILGPCASDGGQAEVMLDGEKVGVLDAYIGERARENVLWHAYDLKSGDHTLVLRTTGKADPRSKGHLITIQTAISYRAPDRPQP